MSTTNLPLLLPASVLGPKSEPDPQEWKPSRYLQAPQPPPKDDTKQHDLEMAAARQLIDGKAFKKVRPRRTIDYFSGVGRWTLVSFFVSSRSASGDLTRVYSYAGHRQVRGIYPT
jgi:polyadenylation factor subunit 2